jgi:hypothetical protein
MFQKLVRQFLDAMNVNIVRPEENSKFRLLGDNQFERDAIATQAFHKQRFEKPRRIPGNSKELGAR